MDAPGRKGPSPASETPRQRVFAARDASDFAERGVGVVSRVVARDPEAAIAFPTGATPLPLYAALVEAQKRGEVDLRRIRAFQLDEFLGLGPEDPLSFRAFLEKHLYRPVALDPSRIDSPRGDAPDAEAECARYEASIAAAGGLDLAVLGVGGNGHIAFNEPGSPAGSRTRVVTLAPETRAAQAGFSAAGRAVPERALTVGIATILAAKEILLLARGAGKAPALARAFLEPAGEDSPASFLQSYARGPLTLLLDEPAAEPLRSRLDPA